MSTPPAMRVADLNETSPNPFELTPDAESRAQIAQALDLVALRKLRFSGAVSVLGKRDWELRGSLGATVVQPCVVTLEPVTTRIDIPVQRQFIANLADETGEEVEMPEDDTTEPLGSHIDPAAVMIEALSLALPEYPRASDATLDEANFAAPGVKPMTDEDTKPFAGLAGLRDALSKEN